MFFYIQGVLLRCSEFSESLLGRVVSRHSQGSVGDCHKKLNTTGF